MRSTTSLEDKEQKVKLASLNYSDIWENDVIKNDGYFYYNNHSIITSAVNNTSLKNIYKNHRDFEKSSQDIKEPQKIYKRREEDIFEIVHKKWLECIGTPFFIKRWDVLEEFIKYNKENGSSKIDDFLLLHKVSNKYQIEEYSKGIHLFFEGKIDFTGIYLDDLIFRIVNKNTVYETFEFCFEKNTQLNYSITSRKDSIIPHLKITLTPISGCHSQKILIKICYGLKQKKSQIEINKTDENVIKNNSETELFLLMTQREREVVQLVLEGNKNSSISEKLFISEGTVKKIIYNVYRKFHISSRVELINLFSENKEKII